MPELIGVRPDQHAALRTEAELAQHRDEQMGVELLGVRKTGTSQFKVKFLAVRATEWVEVHIQHTGAGGGGVDYNDSTYVSRTLVDCRENRLQETTVSTAAGNEYKVFLIPVLMED